MNILEVQNLRKSFKGVEIIKDISFSIKEGETLVILGPSSSGKSTALRCINNLEKIDGGNISINGIMMIKEYKNSKPIIRTPKEKRIKEFLKRYIEIGDGINEKVRYKSRRTKRNVKVF